MIPMNIFQLLIRVSTAALALELNQTQDLNPQGNSKKVTLFQITILDYSNKKAYLVKKEIELFDNVFWSRLFQIVSLSDMLDLEDLQNYSLCTESKVLPFFYLVYPAQKLEGILISKQFNVLYYYDLCINNFIDNSVPSEYEENSKSEYFNKNIINDQGKILLDKKIFNKLEVFVNHFKEVEQETDNSAVLLFPCQEESFFDFLESESIAECTDYDKQFDCNFDSKLIYHEEKVPKSKLNGDGTVISVEECNQEQTNFKILVNQITKDLWKLKFKTLKYFDLNSVDSWELRSSLSTSYSKMAVKSEKICNDHFQEACSTVFPSQVCPIGGSSHAYILDSAELQCSHKKILNKTDLIATLDESKEEAQEYKAVYELNKKRKNKTNYITGESNKDIENAFMLYNVPRTHPSYKAKEDETKSNQHSSDSSFSLPVNRMKSKGVSTQERSLHAIDREQSIKEVNQLFGRNNYDSAVKEYDINSSQSGNYLNNRKYSKSHASSNTKGKAKMCSYQDKNTFGYSKGRRNRGNPKYPKQGHSGCNNSVTLRLKRQPVKDLVESCSKNLNNSRNGDYLSFQRLAIQLISNIFNRIGKFLGNFFNSNEKTLDN